MTRAAINFDLLIKTLGAVVLISVIGGLILTFVGKAVPDSIIGLGATALGGLITAFVRPPETGPTSVTIEDEPVEVTTTPKPKRKRKPGGE